MKIALAGSASFSLPVFSALLNSQHTVECVYTKPDKRVGRGLKSTRNIVKNWADEKNLPCFQPHSKDELQACVLQQSVDVMLVVAYGFILPCAVLEGLPLGCVNAHASLLPRWRGASPIQHAIWHGDKQTGITWMKMDKTLDTGPILKQHVFPIASGMNASELHDALSKLAAEHVVGVFDDLKTKNLAEQAQDNAQATLAQKIYKKDGSIDWKQSGVLIEQQVKALCVWPKCFTFHRKKRLIVHEVEFICRVDLAVLPGTLIRNDEYGLCVACIDGIIKVVTAQLAGGCVQPFLQLTNGYLIQENDTFHA